MKTIYTSIRSLIIASFSLLIFVSCCPDCKDDGGDSSLDSEYAFGYNGEDNLNTTPTTPNYGFGTGNLPNAIDISDRFPPIGNQGNYGTCVAWAVGYNLKTALNAIDNNLSSSELNQDFNQFSAKDLFTAIPNSQKGSNCGGTNFDSAFDVLQQRGIATEQTVPYYALNDCSQSNLQSSWNNEANDNKIKYWRKIDPSINTIKQNIANNIPVVFGAKLSDNFVSWNSSAVLSSNTSYNNVGQHAYHAMIVSGYDNSKGANGAFKVINSWGTGWGNNGYIWIDYNFFITEFVTTPGNQKPLFIAVNEDGNINPPDDSNTGETGVDLASWVFADNFIEGNYRELYFNIYNIGNSSATPSSNWVNAYIYFNAYNANDYGILFYDEYNTSVSLNSFDCPTTDNCIFNYTIPAGGNFAETVFGQSNINRQYIIPNLTGYYYLLLITDANDKFQEIDESNNFFYPSLTPVLFLNGQVSRGVENNDSTFTYENPELVSETKLKEGKSSIITIEDFNNAYTQEEIKNLLKAEFHNGAFQNKLSYYLRENKTKIYGN
ncbi:C1 family peptidase [uncultured Winogradskyella sp.]|uniref:C1 family peptidase n=1 Tax=uncultured Winogradskyella sp. TaxID=395353 RepID=UPI0026105477|nr:C1 family peptidase [uncultured Winogradskyella sp.]